MRQQRITSSAAVGLALAAFAAPAAIAQQDLRNPDSRAPAASVSQDLRSPDTVDAADGRGTFSAPEVTVVKVPAPSVPVASTSGGGLDWADAGIGAGGMLTLILLAGAGSVTVLHRRQHGPRRRQTV